MCRDQSACLDFLLILGTSLTPNGPKMLAKLFAREVCRNRGKVVYMNLTKPRAEWKNLVDYWVKWDYNTWAQDLKECRLTLRVRDIINWSRPGLSFDSPIVID
jgi:NAD-dependent SIR2 family protein deacetylase